ncbi:MAG: hypothetical protein V7676_10950 [Parasphingorhabdus sp.]|uniref:hypothetical protein n=1 Tax=Parasphingorhabdus sp. TaxID=2709688 RepID=UPI003001554D
MTFAYSSEATLSETERYVLGSLNQSWPSPATMTPAVLQTRHGESDSAHFVNIVQTLSDNGMILYEAFLTSKSSGPRFLDTMITARGKAALQSSDITP